MESQILLLVLGFILTTVGGGLLGYYFQNRSWEHQNTAKVRADERATAKDVFESVSVLMDKRMYRMRLLSWGLEDETASDEIIERHMTNYRQILFEWNDSLIRNLALVQAYFGKDIRWRLGVQIYEEFKRIGRILEAQYTARKASKKHLAESKPTVELENLSREIYALNFQMINLIQAGKVGLFNPDVSREIKKQPRESVNTTKKAG
jgi:hypothetical protein